MIRMYSATDLAAERQADFLRQARRRLTGLGLGRPRQRTGR